MAKENRDFKGIWIDKIIWLNKSMSLQEKVFFVEISSLDNELGCFASNEYFAEFFNISKRRCITIVNSLVNKGLIKRKLIYKKGTKQVEKRLLNVALDWQKKAKIGSEGNFTTLVKETSPPPCTFVHHPSEGKFTDSNTISNTISNKEKVNKKDAENFQENSSVVSISEKDQTDIFKNVVGLKKKIGPKQYGLLNKVAQDENIYDLLRNEFYLDGRFEILMNYLEYRKGKRKGYNGTIGMKAIIKLFTEFESIELYDALTKTITNQWQSINPTKNIAQRRLERLRKENTSQLNNYFPTLQQKRAI